MNSATLTRNAQRGTTNLAQRLNCVIELLRRSAIAARCCLDDATAVIEALCC
jgi:hypothetical protein